MLTKMLLEIARMERRVGFPVFMFLLAMVITAMGDVVSLLIGGPERCGLIALVCVCIWASVAFPECSTRATAIAFVGAISESFFLGLVLVSDVAVIKIAYSLASLGVALAFVRFGMVPAIWYLERKCMKDDAPRGVVIRRD